MDNAYFCFTIDDVGLDGYSSPAHLEKLLEFCEDEKLKATLFVVPRPMGKRFPREEYAGLLKNAMKAGHAVGQHGLEHERFEVGIPPKMVLDLPHEGPARSHLAMHRREIENQLTVGNLRQRLREGRAILEDAVGETIDGFRAPCLSVCENLFTALENESYRYDSSKFFQKAGWDLINGVQKPTPCPITRKLFDAFQVSGQIDLYPLTTEYTWYLTRDRFAASLQLAKDDFDACLDADIPFVQLAHVSPIQECEGDCGFSLYRELLAHARQAAERCGKRLVGATLQQLSNITNQGNTP